ncbi:uncharacterized protein BO88DRAFT_442385 [Aspergillus vadensis CBS 113365]|uniref:Integral membrane protein n=1 Tax=Aspergillus vadensis (strain CBS 113365 / IMI 142717 / IBT 24658) TaxID=1448311 RepID=A0A319BJ55_ASPVC|nr:hypothetical protein BO88DRAFT_442385 [Aspergillus vadensis CBS 113365]PYH70940.1 hypothetical protein BO88DRAFT_442385 [Aspergillus vadensis CBS 113365]
MTNLSRLRHLSLGRSSLHPTGLLFCIFSVLYLLSISYYRSTSYRDPTSFFDPNRAYEQRYSAHRIHEAKSFLSRASDFPSRAKPLSNDQATICVGIVTVRRRREQYVGLTIASLLEGLTESERDTIFLDLLIAHTDPSTHPIFSEKWVEVLPDRVLLYPKEDDLDYEQIREWEEGGWYRNKTIYDFTHLMKDCYDTGADYVAMRSIAGQDWVYLRLFYVDDLLGWNSEEWPRYLALSFVVWAAATGFVVFIKRRFFKTASAIHEMNKYGCCSQGLIFPRSIVPRFLEHTDLTTDWLVDMMVEKIADKEEWNRYVVVPPVLQHIGATSSKGYGFDKSAKTIWNFRYEEYPY